MLKNKTIVLGVCGGIAVYKVAALVRLFKKAEADVHVVMTKNAREFVTPMTFQTLSCNPVHTDMWDLLQEADVDHISLADRADIFVIAPATANMVGKAANGIADDLLSTSLMATRAPLIFVPSMNVNMFRNPVNQTNLQTLRDYGFHVMQPATGFLACGYDGEGKLPEPEDILEFCERVAASKDLEGETVLITAGPTREDIDPVRYISNYSSGKMGFAIAKAAWQRGARVLLVHGPSAEKVPYGVEPSAVTSAQQMHDKVMELLPEATIVIKAAAVADYRPADPAEQKLKKEKGLLEGVSLVPNPDILAAVGQKKEDRLLVGFAAETDDLRANAQRKLETKNLDLIVANDVSRTDAGFNVDQNAAVLLDRDGGIEELPLQSKTEMAHAVLSRVARFRADG